MPQHGNGSRAGLYAPLLALVIALATALLTPLAAPALGGSGDDSVPEATAPFKLKVATFNILGSQHTARPGGFAPGYIRAGYTADLIQMKNPDVIGMQEVQQDQLRVLGRELDDYWIWPYKFIEGRKIDTRFDGNTRPIPYVRLRDRASGQEFWFLSFHNSRRMAERNGSTVALVNLVNRLRGTGIPVVIGGDSNTWFDFACRMGHNAEMQNAAGGRLYPCRPPRNPEFDVLLSNPRLTFGKYRQLGGRIVWRASDHKFVTAKVTMADPAP